MSAWWQGACELRKPFALGAVFGVICSVDLRNGVISISDNIFGIACKLVGHGVVAAYDW
jgi:hypothetical protein